MNSRSRVYLEGHHALAPHLAEYAQALNDADFNVMSEWHDNGVAAPLITELIVHLAKCDMMIVFAAGAAEDTWVKVGWALASGLRVVAVGSRQTLPSGFETILGMRFETWEDLASNRFVRLGSSRFKKGRR